MNPNEHNRAVAEVEPLVSITEAQRLLGIGRTSLWKICSQGQLPIVEVGGRRLIERAAIRAFIERHRGVSHGRHSDLSHELTTTLERIQMAREALEQGDAPAAIHALTEAAVTLGAPIRPGRISCSDANGAHPGPPFRNNR